MSEGRTGHFKGSFQISWLFIGCIMYGVSVILIVCWHLVQRSENEIVFISKETAVPKCTTCIAVQSITSTNGLPDFSTELPSVSIEHISLSHSVLTESRYTPNFETVSSSNGVARVSVSLSETEREGEPRETDLQFQGMILDSHPRDFRNPERNQGDTGTNMLRDCLKYSILSLFWSFIMFWPLYPCFGVLCGGMEKLQYTPTPTNGRIVLAGIGTGLIGSAIIGLANNMSDYEISIFCLSRLPIWVIGACVLYIVRSEAFVALLLLCLACGVDITRIVD